MSEGKRRVERIPRDWVAVVAQRVRAGREFQDAVREVLAANAELLVLARSRSSSRSEAALASSPETLCDEVPGATSFISSTLAAMDASNRANPPERCSGLCLAGQWLQETNFFGRPYLSQCGKTDCRP
jgi:hypothetical protein